MCAAREPEPEPDPDPEDHWIARDPLPGEPLAILARWLAAAFAGGAQRNPHAMTLASVGPDGRPSARLVLCKGIDVEAGTLRFFSHYASRKGRELGAHPEAALAFYFGGQERQVRVEGSVARLGAAESDAYFASRPLDARLGAWASQQSDPIGSREQLEARLAQVAERFGVALDPARREGAEPDVPRPPGWGGYRVEARRVELWRGRGARLHDRALYERPAAGAPWRVSRLQP